MFVDRAIVEVESGKGGDGMIAFLHEKYLPKGGPAGGNGGRGGSVIFRAKEGLNTLSLFRRFRYIKAEEGGRGQAKNKYGRGAEDVYVDVPPGTVIYLAEDHSFIADLAEPGAEAVVAKGGRGGRGNAAFKSARDRTPNIAENGLPGERKKLLLELKLLADVGLVGLPNAGKSTLLSIITRATPLIASYPFTTLEPNLGVAADDPDQAFVVADLPGLIEGAHVGRGLGLAFLRHLERCRLLCHVVAMDGEKDPVEAYRTLKAEIKAYGYGLTKRPSIVAASKMDVPGADERLKEFRRKVRATVIPVSSWERTGLEALLKKMRSVLSETPPFLLEEEKKARGVKIYDARKAARTLFTVNREKEHVFRLSGEGIERTAKLINTSTDEGMIRLLAYLRKIDVESELRRKGAVDGDLVRLLDFEFEYIE